MLILQVIIHRDSNYNIIIINYIVIIIIKLVLAEITKMYLTALSFCAITVIQTSFRRRWTVRSSGDIVSNVALGQGGNYS